MEILACIFFLSYIYRPWGRCHRPFAQNDQSLFDANVEALSDGEASMKIECDNFSLTMICQKTCVCGQTWRTLQGYGHAITLHGTCVCGRHWD